MRADRCPIAQQVIREAVAGAANGISSLDRHLRLFWARLTERNAHELEDRFDLARQRANAIRIRVGRSSRSAMFSDLEEVLAVVADPLGILRNRHQHKARGNVGVAVHGEVSDDVRSKGPKQSVDLLVLYEECFSRRLRISVSFEN